MQKIVVALIAVASIGISGIYADTDIQDSWKNAGSRHFTCRRKTETADYRAISDRGNDSAVDGFLVAIIIFLPLADTLNSFLFDSITQSTIHKNYLQPDFPYFCHIVHFSNLSVLLTVLVCSGAILSLKPKEILTKMS